MFVAVQGNDEGYMQKAGGAFGDVINNLSYA